MKKIITLPSILSIDAPIIGLTWYLYFSNLYGIKPNVVYSLIIFSSIWLGYMSDRLFDAKNLKSIRNLSARHAFALKHSSSIWLIWVIILISTALICLFFLNKEKIIACILLAIIVLIYHLLCQCLLRKSFIKELAVPIIFASAIHLFLEYETNINDFFNFSLICFMNCIFLSKMDQQCDTKMGFTNITHAFRPQIFSYFFLFTLIYFILSQSLLINPYTIITLIILLLDKISFRFSREGIRFFIETMYYIVPVCFILSS